MSRISSTPELFAIYKRYLADWMSAEEIIKRAELISQEVNYPAVQELRYAARRIVDAEYAADNGKKDEDIRWHLSEACENCRKAKHDAIDASILFVHVELDELVSKTGLDVVAQAFPQYSDLIIEMEEVGDRIVASRKRREILDTEYDAIAEKHLHNVVDLYRKLKLAKPVVVAIEKRRTRDFWRAVILVGLVVSVVGGGTVVFLDKMGAFEFIVDLFKR